MKLKPKELYNLITANNYKSARIYEGLHDGNLSEVMDFETIFKTSPDDLINRIKELEGVLSGDFTIALGNGSKTQKISHCKKIPVEFSRVTIIKPQLNAPSQTFENTEVIDQRVAELVDRKLKEIEEQKRIEELEEKLKELETWGGKLNHLLTNFLNGYISKMQTNMAGNGQMQGTETNFDPNQLQITDLENSLAIITDFLGQENIIRMAKKIQNGQADMVKPIIINFINS